MKAVKGKRTHTLWFSPGTYLCHWSSGLLAQSSAIQHCRSQNALSKSLLKTCWDHPVVKEIIVLTNTFNTIMLQLRSFKEIEHYQGSDGIKLTVMPEWNTQEAYRSYNRKGCCVLLTFCGVLYSNRWYRTISRATASTASVIRTEQSTGTN